MMNFFISNNSYSKWFKSNYYVLYSISLIDIPEPLTQCEKLFDKNVLPIKKLVKGIGDLNNLTIKETKNYFLYDDSNFISNTFFTELNKKIECYGFISLLYNNSDKKLVNSKNRLKFNILKNKEKEFLTIQLEDILVPKKIETTDSRIRNFSILATNKLNMEIVDEIKIEGFQNFEQYMKINPVDIRITDPEIQTKLLYYSKRFKYRFIANSLLFSLWIKEDIKVSFITTNGLNDAKEILINSKIFQRISVIYISEIENWDKIKNKLHWTNVILTATIYPVAAKHFAFGFERTDLHNLLISEYSLINDQGKLLEFKQGEDKIPALNFTIQVI